MMTEVQDAIDGLPGTVASLLELTLRDGLEDELISGGCLPKLLAIVSHGRTHHTISLDLTTSLQLSRQSEKETQRQAIVCLHNLAAVSLVPCPTALAEWI